MTRTGATHGPLWGARAREWAEIQEGTVKPLFESVLGRVGIGKGTSLLDVGCGAGMFCALAAERGAQVAGLDAAEGMIAVARERTPAGNFLVGEIEDLPREHGAFDVVTGFNSFQFAGDPANALRKARRVVSSEGQLVVAVWGEAKDCDAAAVIKAIAELLPPPPPGTAGPFALSEPGALEALVEEAGFTPEGAHEVPCPWVYPDLDTAVRGIGSSRAANRAEQGVGRQAVEQALAAALQPFGDGTGIYRLENVFRYLVARP
jgi:2-polyprenyl-3-methyl-5-hydroxy-6-metoxy-1,4-benzoquinol methylase